MSFVTGARSLDESIAKTPGWRSILAHKRIPLNRSFGAGGGLQHDAPGGEEMIAYESLKPGMIVASGSSLHPIKLSHSRTIVTVASGCSRVGR